MLFDKVNHTFLLCVCMGAFASVFLSLSVDDRYNINVLIIIVLITVVVANATTAVDYVLWFIRLCVKQGIELPKYNHLSLYHEKCPINILFISNVRSTSLVVQVNNHW